MSNLSLLNVSLSAPDHKKNSSIKIKILNVENISVVVMLVFEFFKFPGLVKKYNEVIQRYYVQYLSGYDAVLLSQLIQVHLHNGIFKCFCFFL